MKLSFTHFRHCCVLLLFSLFAWQAVSSVLKYREAVTTINVQSRDVSEHAFPSVSVCPFDRVFGNKSVEDRGKERNKTFSEQVLGAKREDFWIHFEHKSVSGLITSESSDSDRWSRTITTDPWSGLLVECYTYTTPDLYSPKYSSALNLRFESENYNLGFIVNSKGDNLLIPNNIHSRFFFNFPFLPSGALSRYSMYQLSIGEAEVMQKKGWPCHEDGFNMYDCVESYVEDKEECSLPWRTNSSRQRYPTVCADATRFKRVHDMYKDATEQEVHRITGCYSTCTYTKYRVSKLMEESYDYRISPQYTQLMVLNLRPGGTPVETEVLVFDLFDLVGNVGGFLGLFLGASLLTLLDEAKELLDKCREKFKKKPNKRVPSHR